MEPYRRKDVATPAFFAPDGSVIDYGNRWAFGDGPPEDSYSRITHPERFAQLQELARDLIRYLVFHFDAKEETPDGSDFPLVDPSINRSLVKVIPADPACSPITFELTSEGVRLHYGTLMGSHHPPCNCDACDETLESAAADMEWTVFAVVNGGLREAVDLSDPLPVWHELRGDGGSRSGYSPLDDLSDHWKDLARTMHNEPAARHWTQWPHRTEPHNKGTVRKNGSTTTAEAHLLLDSIAALFENQRTWWIPGCEWIRGRVLDDDSVVVLYRESASGPILGRRYILPEFKALFDDDLSIKDLAQIIVTDEIGDPTGHGEVLPVDWADGLVPAGEHVEWTGLDTRQWR
ncbi:DUF6226 family protein [Arthrobacter sp. CAN_C5]|uniref:DUF6226 family protein n=1 Tax=Arthrobacter sp. CAN_C5 TaxID=2760706 RepID=UPI001AE94BAB|nr:DUF6226 family protein [Arthrobacter sp. CAN_C5]MBP2215040.1 hypothetical protein [Arthrobacter sp. CAN_C5]